MLMTRLFLGLDVGSSKTHALLSDESGEALGFGESGAGNHEIVGYEGLFGALQAATRQALVSAAASINDVAGAGFGVAGYDWTSERPATLQAIARLGLQSPVEAVNDALVGLIAGAPEGWGVAVVSGTGCNCWGRAKDGRQGQVTGIGGMGEAGGGGDLVRKAVQAIAYEWCRRGPATRLTQAFIQLTGARDLPDLVEGLCEERYSVSYRHAPLVFEVANAGDAVAQGVVRWAGTELGELAKAVIRQLGFESLAFDVVLVGSLFKGSPLLTEALRDNVLGLAPAARFVRLTVPPVVGGVLLGMEQADLDAPARRERLIESAAALLSPAEARA